MKKILCFGEVLWDILPNGHKKIGGAPLNVAYHLKKLGIDSGIISRVGSDKEGDRLIRFIEELSLPYHLIQKDKQYQTGKAIATLAGPNEMVYDIVSPVAWDFISFEDQHKDILKKTDALVYGSLACRNDVSRKTLYQMLAYVEYKVFDVNIRKPHADLSVIQYLLSQSDLVKLNETETVILGEHFALGKSENQIVDGIFKNFAVKEILVTKGEQGGSYYDHNQKLDYEAKKVKVKDTVGSGDSFLAGFLSERVSGSDIIKCLDTASRLSGLVTSLEGGCPEYDILEIEDRFLK